MADDDNGIDLTYDSSLPCFVDDETPAELNHYFLVEPKITSASLYFFWLVTLPNYVTDENKPVFMRDVVSNFMDISIDCCGSFVPKKQTCKTTILCNGMNEAIIIYNRVQRAKKKLKIEEQNLTLFKPSKPIEVCEFKLVYQNSPNPATKDVLSYHASHFFRKNCIVIQREKWLLLKDKTWCDQIKNCSRPPVQIADF
jgi:hypothetical protein